MQHGPYTRYTYVHICPGHNPKLGSWAACRCCAGWRAPMNTPLSNENFGLVIAYVLPGFVALWGVSYFSPTVESWITATQQGAPSVAGFMYVTVASLAAGLTVSAVRWAIIDTIHHATGVIPPAWEFAVLNDKLPGFLGLDENHYRYYQHHSNMFVAVALLFRSVDCRGQLPRSLAVVARRFCSA